MQSLDEETSQGLKPAAAVAERHSVAEMAYVQHGRDIQFIRESQVISSGCHHSKTPSVSGRAICAIQALAAADCLRLTISCCVNRVQTHMEFMDRFCDRPVFPGNTAQCEWNVFSRHIPILMCSC